jgi:prepilin-type N-terminal cleavage/methylation domain-containing protein
MRKGLTLIELLAVISIIAVLIALLLPAIQLIRQSAGLASSANNQRQIILGLHQLVQNDGILPGTIEGGEGNPWVRLLPLVGEQNLFLLFTDQSLPPTGSSIDGRVKQYRNPLDFSDQVVHGLSRESESSYVLNGQFWCFYPNIHQVVDGLSNTVWLSEQYGYNCGGVNTSYLIGTITHNSSTPSAPYKGAVFAEYYPQYPVVNWNDWHPITSGSPPVSDSIDGRTFNVTPRVADCNPRMLNSSTKSGLQVGMADGSVRLLAPHIRSTLFWALVTHDQGDAAE